MKKSPSQLLIASVVLFGILSVSTSSIFIRFSQNESVNSMVISTYRLVVASLILTPIVLIKYREELRSIKRKQLILGLISGVFLSLHFFSWITSLEFTSITSSVVLVTTTPLWVAILAPFLLKEKVNKLLLIGMVVSLVGGVIIGISDTCSWQNGLVCPDMNTFLKDNSLWGNFLALFGAWMAAGYIMIGRELRSNLSLIPYIFLVYGLAAIFSLGLILTMGLSIFGYTPITYVWLILLGVVPQLLGHSSFNWSLKYVKASLVSVMLLGEPIGSTILGFIIFHETPTLIKIVGGVLILAGIFITTYRQK
jgi:drug/metabolite transporter (DMT)-like permease